MEYTSRGRLVGSALGLDVWEITYRRQPDGVLDSISVVVERAESEYSEIMTLQVFPHEGVIPVELVTIGNRTVLVMARDYSGSYRVLDYGFLWLRSDGASSLDFSAIDPAARKWVGSQLLVYPIVAEWDFEGQTWSSCVQPVKVSGSRRFVACLGTVYVEFRIRGNRAVPVRIRYERNEGGR